MSQARLLTLFQQSTEMYKNEDYQACIALLNDCLLFLPSSPTLYSNRAIANFHLSNLQQAQKDLRHAIEVDYLNHVAYFNLFSVHLTNAEPDTAFENLCFSLSSLCVKVAKSEKNLGLAERAIFYSYNNKEALSLKGLLQFEKGHLELALDYLTQAAEWQTDAGLKQNMQKTITWLVEHTKKENVKIQQKFVSGSSYKLLTTLNYSQTPRKDEVLSNMLQEFNNLYSRWLKSSEQQIKLLSEVQNEPQVVSKLNTLSIRSEMKEDKMGEKLTTYTSKVVQDQPHTKEQVSNLQSTNNQQSFNKSQNSTKLIEQPQKQEVERNKKSQKQNSINFRIYYAQILPSLQKTSNNFYAVLKYNNQKNGIAITTCKQESNTYIQWNELSDSFKLSRGASNLEIKIYDKNLYKLQDDLLGVGWLQVSQLGVANVPLMDSGHRHIANIVVGVQLCRE